MSLLPSQAGTSSLQAVLGRKGSRMRKWGSKAGSGEPRKAFPRIPSLEVEVGGGSKSLCLKETHKVLILGWPLSLQKQSSLCLILDGKASSKCQASQ
jgi:hypothetical protein